MGIWSRAILAMGRAYWLGREKMNLAFCMVKDPPFEVVPEQSLKIQSPFFGLHDRYGELYRTVEKFLKGATNAIRCHELYPEEEFFSEDYLNIDLACGEGFKLMLPIRAAIVVVTDNTRIAAKVRIVLPFGFTVEERAPSIIAALFAGSKSFNNELGLAEEFGQTESQIIDSIEVITFEWEEDLSLLPD